MIKWFSRLYPFDWGLVWDLAGALATPTVFAAYGRLDEVDAVASGAEALLYWFILGSDT